MIISAWWLRISCKFSGKKSKKQPENLEMDNSQAGADYNITTVAFSLQEDKDGTNKQKTFVS